MSEKRKDKKGRILRNGECQMSDGRYRFKYVDEEGRECVVYSWRLERTDLSPKGKRIKEALREMEKRIQADRLNNISSRGANMTVLTLVERYVSTRVGVKVTTRAGYKTVMNFLMTDSFGNQRIDKVKMSDVKRWFIKLQRENGKGYSSLHTIRGVINPAFQMAMDDDLIRKNPFAFPLGEVIINDSNSREALSQEQEQKLLAFIKEDKVYSDYRDH